MNVNIKRAYLPAEKSDGTRVLIDRLWPRGVSKEKAKISLWLKAIAPSTELRKWFGHDTEKWAEFQKRYKSELKKNKEAVAELKKVLKRGRTTLIYGARDEEHNDAVVLQDYLKQIRS
jgi:uncharacterized protein YeaO (DUF488 family)